MTKEIYNCPICDYPNEINGDLKGDENDIKIIKIAVDEYIKKYEAYENDKLLISEKELEYIEFINKHNKKFWCNKWEFSNNGYCIEITNTINTKWYKLGQPKRIIKQYVIKNPKPSKLLVFKIYE